MNFEIAPKETEIRANWYDAKLYCFSLNIDGKVGWRLPTLEELEEIFLSVHDLEPDGYWSSTENDDGGAFVKYFFDGYQYSGRKNSGHGSVRAIRTI
jgi:hypothetical protein